MDLNSTIESIRNKLKEGKLYNNESSISQGIVLPVLNALNWPIFDTNIVVPEYSVERRRVDFALCTLPREPKVFIEVKNIGLAEGADRQLFEYAFHKGIPLAILTDGKEWHFFLPSGEGDYTQRRIYKLDLIERDSEASAHYLSRYLEYEKIMSGEAIDHAKRDYKNVAQKRKVEQVLPAAWNRLLQEKDEIILELLSEKTEDLCGYKPDYDMCSNFLSKIQNESHSKPSISRTVQKKQDNIKTKENRNKKEGHYTSSIINGEQYPISQLINMEVDGSRPLKLTIQNNHFEVKYWSDVCVIFISWLVEHNYLSSQNLPILNAGRGDKYFVNMLPQHANESRDAIWKEAKGFYVDTKYSTRMHIKNILATMEQLKIKELDIQISF